MENQALCVTAVKESSDIPISLSANSYILRLTYGRISL